MKKTGLKRLHMEAEEIVKNIQWLQRKIETSILPRERDRNLSNLHSQVKKLEGLKDKAFNYAKNEVVYGFKLQVEGVPGERKIYYSNVEEEELELLLNRDLKGLEYKVLKKTKIKTGEIFS